MIKQFTQGESSISYQEQGQGPVILFGHNYLYDSSMWNDTVAELSQTYRCITLDFWAHGQSSQAPMATSNLRDYAQQVLALMDELQIEQFSIVGAFLGGVWACELAVLAPQRVTSLVLLNTFVGLEPQVMHKKYFAIFEAMQQKKLPDEVSEWLAPLYFSANLTDKSILDNLTTSLQNVDEEQMVALSSVGRMLFGRRELVEEIEQLALPALIIAGQDDKIRTPLEAYLMQDCLTGSQLEVVTGAGHMSVLEKPQRVLALMSRFLFETMNK